MALKPHSFTQGHQVYPLDLNNTDKVTFLERYEIKTSRTKTKENITVPVVRSVCLSVIRNKEN